MKNIITLIILCSISLTSFAAKEHTKSEHIRKHRWDVSPAQLRYLSLFFAGEITAYMLLQPKYARRENPTGDFDFDEDDISVPKWAYQLGNHGPTLMTIGQYGYYLFGNDEHAFEKAFVLTESLLISQGITFGMKYTFNQERPDSSNYLSFPSGHTTHAFVLGTWISMEMYHGEMFKKNLLISSLPTLYAAYVGWTRIDAKKHKFTDVLAGAFIGTTVTSILYKYHFDDNGKYKFKSKSNFTLTPLIDIQKETYGLNFRMSF